MPRSVLGPAVWYPPAANRRADFVALRWTQSAYGDLRRLYEFLKPVNPRAAVRAVRLIAAKYEIRYELTDSDVVVLRIFRAREDL